MDPHHLISTTYNPPCRKVLTKVVKFVVVVDLLKKLNKRMTCTAVPARTMRNIETNDSPQKEKKRNIRTIGNLELNYFAHYSIKQTIAKYSGSLTQ